jgi:hypothetical protein
MNKPNTFTKKNKALSLAILAALSLSPLPGAAAPTSSLKALSGAAAQGIVGTGASTQGIVGTGASTQGIVGTGKLGLDTDLAVAFQRWAATVNSDGLPLLAYGSIEDITEDGYIVLGQRVYSMNHAGDPPYEVGTTVAAFGLVSADGLFADKVLQINEPSVDGSSPVFLAAIVAGSQAPDGSVNIGRVTIHVGAAGSRPESFELQTGDYVEIAGRRFNNLVVAESIVSD